MKTVKMLTILVVALGLILCEARVSEAAEMGTAFTYQGHLYDANYPADGLYDFQFKLYDDPYDPCDANQVGGDVNKPDVDVFDAYFTVELDFGGDANAFNGEARWLEIGVRAGELSGDNDANAYTVLQPRQEVTPTPYALYAASGPGVPVPLELSGSSSDAIIKGTNTGSGYGVQGEAEGASGRGVYGKASDTGSVMNYGGYFEAWGNDGRGVHGEAIGASGLGGYFKATGNQGKAVYGLAEAAGDVKNFGGYFQAEGQQGRGVEGWAAATGDVNNFGGYFTAAGDNGRGVYGEAAGINAYAGYFEGRGYFSGNVGVGTTDPGAELEVNGQIKITGGSPGGGKVLTSDASGLGSWGTLPAGGDSDWIISDSNMYSAVSGNVGIGTSSPQELLSLYQTPAASLLVASASEGDARVDLVETTLGNSQFGTANNFGFRLFYDGWDNNLYFQSGEGTTITTRMAIERDTGNVGIGVTNPGFPLSFADSVGDKISLWGQLPNHYGLGLQSHLLQIHTDDAGSDIAFGHGSSSNFFETVRFKGNGRVGIGTDSPTEMLTVRGGNLLIEMADGTDIVELGEGLDYAEGFDVSDKQNIGSGTVLVIDAENPGQLAVSDKAYDSKVAGIVAGAKGMGSGVRLGAGQFDYDVALAGRVYCNVDATEAAVQPGDLLTTSVTPGYAMKATDYIRAQGAILGKAMETLEKGKKGQILVLVTLQ